MSDFFGPDTFRIVLIYKKKQESRKKFHNRAKKFLFLRRLTVETHVSRNLIRKDCFQMTLNARQSSEDSL